MIASLTIEFIQLILGVGTFEFSDIMCNTVGGVIGIKIDQVENVKRGREYKL